MLKNKGPILVIGENGQLANALRVVSKKIKLFRPIIFKGSSKINLETFSIDNFNIIFEEINPALVINTGAYTNVEGAENDKNLAMKINAEGVGKLAKACSKRKINLFHVSTDYVFNGKSKNPYRTLDLPDPLNNYGKSKLAGEKLLSPKELNYFLIRVSWIFSIYGKNFVKTMINLAMQNDEIKVVSDQVGGPTSANSIASIILNLIEPAINNYHPNSKFEKTFPWGTYHYQGEPCISWYEYALEIFQQAYDLGILEKIPRVIPIKSSESKSNALRPKNSKLDCSKLEKQFGLNRPPWKKELKNVLTELWK